MEIHEGEISALDSIHRHVVMDTDDQKVTQRLGTLQKLDMPRVEEIKGTVDIDNLVARVGLAALGELDDALRGRQKVRDAGADAEETELGGVEARERRGTGTGRSLVVVPRHEQHTTDQLGGRDALSALALAIKASILDGLVAVRAIRHGRNIVAVHAKVDTILLEDLNRGVVGCIGNDLVDPLAGSYSGVALLLTHHRGTLILGDLGIGVHTDHEDIAHALGLNACQHPMASNLLFLGRT